MHVVSAIAFIGLNLPLEFPRSRFAKYTFKQIYSPLCRTENRQKRWVIAPNLSTQVVGRRVRAQSEIGAHNLYFFELPTIKGLNEVKQSNLLANREDRKAHILLLIMRTVRKEPLRELLYFVRWYIIVYIVATRRTTEKRAPNKRADAADATTSQYTAIRGGLRCIIPPIEIKIQLMAYNASIFFGWKHRRI